MYSQELVVCIVNNGFSDVAMDAAREYGARGGTVIKARGTANPSAEKFFKINIQPEKEMVMIVVPHEIKDDILHALYKAVGRKTPGQGIVFTLPVEASIGLNGSIENKPQPIAQKSEKVAKKEVEKTAKKETVKEVEKTVKKEGANTEKSAVEKTAKIESVKETKPTQK